MCTHDNANSKPNISVNAFTKNRWDQEVNNFVTNQCFVFLMNNQEDATINLKTCCSISGKRDTVKVLLVVGFYNILWSMGSWIRGFKQYRQQSME